MRSKLLKRCSLSLALALLLPAVFTSRVEAAVAVTPYNVANTMVLAGDPTATTVFYLDTSYGGVVSPGYGKYAFNAHETFNFSISGAGADPANPYLWAFVESTTPGNYVTAPIATCSGGTIGGIGRCDNGTVDSFIVGIDFQAICIANGANVRGCNGATVNLTPPITGFRLRFLNGPTSAPTGTAASGALIQVIPQISPPNATTPAGAGFFPGDASILVETGGILGTSNSTSGSSPVFPVSYIVAQEGGTVTDGSELSSTIVQTVAYNSGQQEITGFKNSTQSSPVLYDMKLGVQDSAGAVAFSATHYPNVFATNIQGFLRESNCFVATASYRDGRAPGVMLLRNFRDKILSNSKPGRAFISWYYENGPIAADWLITHPIFRSFSLMLLLPLQAVAWTALHPAFLLIPFISLILLLSFLSESFGLIGLLFLASFLLTGNGLASDQPYIDSLISELPKEETQDSYIQSVSRKIGKGEDSTGYTEEMKKQIPMKDESEGYSESVKKTLPKASGSAIEDYRNGKQLKANKGSLDTRSAFGFNLAASSKRTYTTGANQDLAYDSVYGNGWVPDFTLHYEWRPFTGSFIKKFGLYTSFGASFTKANGVFNFTNGGQVDTRSRTEFKFITLPLNVGLIYRVNMFDFIWPYFGAGPSAIGFIESRNDKQKGHQGHDYGYWFLGGVAFGLDWMSSKSSWDQYESTGVKHSYFTIDYSYLQSVAGGLVEFTVDGVQLGFTFEI